MRNNKGFTLTEVLLAAMIVGIIGVALAALTTAALRESSMGRVRLTLRNQISLFLRQLRQDVRESEKMSIKTDEIILQQTADSELGPNHKFTTQITYACKPNGVCTRNGSDGNGAQVVLSYIQPGTDKFPSPGFYAESYEGQDSIGAVLHVRLIVGIATDATQTTPAIKELVDETIILPQGFAVNENS